jgi:EamA domain-containing membrane protein RarD
MKKEYMFIHYLPLVAVMVAAIVGFVLFSHDTALKISLAIATGFSYFVWGLVHHYIHKDLSIDVVIEYLVICIFGVISIISLVK